MTKQGLFRKNKRGTKQRGTRLAIGGLGAEFQRRSRKIIDFDSYKGEFCANWMLFVYIVRLELV